MYRWRSCEHESFGEDDGSYLVWSTVERDKACGRPSPMFRLLTDCYGEAVLALHRIEPDLDTAEEFAREAGRGRGS